MLQPVVDLLGAKTPLLPPFGGIVVCLGLFVCAWLVARLAAAVAKRVLAWHDERRHENDPRRRETLVALVRTSIAYAAFVAALVLSVAQFTGGFDRLTTLTGASFALVLVAFAIQRTLVDLISGLFMFFEKWYGVGDTVTLVPWDLQGVVEDVSLRRTKLRALNGEVIHVHNSQIYGARVLPRGVKELSVELFVSDADEGCELVEEVAALMPQGPTTCIRRPAIAEVETLSEALARISIRAKVAPGREWLVEGFFTDLLKERADESLIHHGPVVLDIDDRAARSFARATAGVRRQLRAVGSSRHGSGMLVSGRSSREPPPAAIQALGTIASAAAPKARAATPRTSSA
jgi:moderate conductance mechanosensitive channel